MRAASALTSSAECSTSCSAAAPRRHPLLHRPLAAHRPSRRQTAACASLAEIASTTAAARERRAALLSAVQYTGRGSNATKQLRGEVEEAQIALEACQANEGLDYAQLPGLWRLVWTTAVDVVPIVGLDLARLLPAGLPAPVVVGDVFQRFSSVEEGLVENVIEFGLPPFTDERRGVTFTVCARCARLMLVIMMPVVPGLRGAACTSVIG